MRIAIIGHGKMGREVERLAAGTEGMTCVVYDRSHPFTDNAKEPFDVAIDFSHASAVVSTIETLGRQGKNVVVGTTGWDDRLEEVKSIVARNGIGLIHSPNFSFGMHVFSELVREAAKRFGALEDYDVALDEIHHRHKTDAPSGTALRLGRIILQEWKRKRAFAAHGVPKRDELQISSTRLGETVGEHRMLVDSPFDRIELTHIARNRAAFAAGALRAAQWIAGKRGVFTMDDMMRDVLRK